MGEFLTLAEYVGFLYCMKLDSEITGKEFAYQKELDALEKWAHSIPKDEYEDDDD